jgi:hypothetical protein
MNKNKEIVEIKYYRRKYTNSLKKYGYDEKGYEVDMDADGTWMAKKVRVEITENQYRDCKAGKLNLIEPYPMVEEHLYEGLRDTEGTPLKLGDWVRVECGTLSFDVKVFFDHRYRLTPFDNFGWHEVVKLDTPPQPSPAWATQILRRDREAVSWPTDLELQMDVMDRKAYYQMIQKNVFDYYGVECNKNLYR